MTDLILTPGMHLGVLPEVYHSDPCERPSLSSSIAHTLVSQSEAHAWLQHPRLGGTAREPSNEMDHGTLFHALMLGHGRAVVIVDADDWRTKAAKDLREEARASGHIAVLRHKYNEAQTAAGAVTARLQREFGVVLDGYSEVVFVWAETAEDGTEVLCRCQVDHWKPEACMVYDLKSTGDAHPDTCARKLVSMGYAIQRAAYVSAVEHTFPELAGRVGFEFLFCEVNEPHAVTPIGCAGTMREVGEMQWRQAVNRWARALRGDDWPTYTRSTVLVEAKPWELEAAMYAQGAE
jgi:hypothetical protein